MQSDLNNSFRCCYLYYSSLTKILRMETILKFTFSALLLSTAALTSMGLSPAYAQSASDKPLVVVIPFAPGGGTDVLARMTMPKIAEKLGTVAVIENRSGAAGAIGAQFTARAAPDGKTLMVGSVSEIGINPSVYPKLPYNVDRDFVAVTALAASPMVLVVNPASSIKTAADLVSQAQANPGKINFGSAGTGSGAHMAAELFIYATKIKLMHVPYKGTGPAMTDLVGGQIEGFIDPVLGSVQFHKNGQLKVVGVTSAKRLPNLPDVATVSETIPDFQCASWYGLWGPAKLPVDMVQKLNVAVNKALSGEMRDRLIADGIVPAGGSVEADTAGSFMVSGRGSRGVQVREVCRWMQCSTCRRIG
jgi:tripartite-type tricarboxylate transporter receptor subunit TctC